MTINSEKPSSHHADMSATADMRRGVGAWVAAGTVVVLLLAAVSAGCYGLLRLRPTPVVSAAQAFPSRPAALPPIVSTPPLHAPVTRAEKPARKPPVALPPLSKPAPPTKPEALAEPPSAPLPATAENVVALQPYRTRTEIRNARGDKIALTNLNPYVGAWYVLEWTIGGKNASAHVEAAALRGRPELRPALALGRDGLTVTPPGSRSIHCPLWPPAPGAAADGAELNADPRPAPELTGDDGTGSPYVPLCDGLLLVRQQRPGSVTRLENATDLLRATRLGGWFVEATKPYLIAAPELGEEHQGADAAPSPLDSAPRNADIDPAAKTLYAQSPKLGIETDAPGNRYVYGQWYQAKNHPAVFAAMMKPTAAPEAIRTSYPERVSPIGKHDRARKEADALVYMVAFDMAHFRFGYSLGADHPKVDWSTRADKTKEQGPDGFNTLAPLCTVGALPPYYLSLVAATFVGGFKREHGAFRSGPYAKVNQNSHFGFVESGVIGSVPHPGLATAAITRDGKLELFTWPEYGDALLTRYAWLRQNCLPIIEGLDAEGASIPGAYVNDWGAGAWGGDQSGDIVSLRSGLAVQENRGRRFLIFTFFTGASPNAMARVFQALHSNYAMLLDMNTANYCYLALCNRKPDGEISGAEYLHQDMNAGNGNDGSLKFIQKNDTRDFFYVLNNPDAGK